MHRARAAAALSALVTISVPKLLRGEEASAKEGYLVSLSSFVPFCLCPILGFLP